MAGQRGGRRKRGGDQETHRSGGTDQEVASPPPFVSRYPKRTSRGVVQQPLSLSCGNAREMMNTNPCQSRSLAIRNLNEVKVIPKPDPVGENSEVKLSPWTQSPGCPPSSSQLEGTREVPPQSQDIKGDSRPPMENDAVSRAVGAEVVLVQEESTAKDMYRDSVSCAVGAKVVLGQEKSTVMDVTRSGQRLSQSHSLNITEFARANRDDSDDPDEIQSAPDLFHDIVQGHKVKKEIAPLLRDIYQKYGDITVETTVNPPMYLSFLLEELCGVYQKLETSKLIDLTHAEITEMIDKLKFMERLKISARWLLKKLEEILEVKTSLPKYKMFKDKEKKCNEANGERRKNLKQWEIHVAIIQKKYADTTRAIEKDDAEANECRKEVLDLKARVNFDLLKIPLVHGLL